MPKNCGNCKHWENESGKPLGECTRVWPTPNGLERALWPRTAAVDRCFYHVEIGSLHAGKVTAKKTTNEQIAGVVAEAGEMPFEQLRGVLEMSGFTPDSARMRISRMVKAGILLDTEGLLTMGADDSKPPSWNLVKEPIGLIAGGAENAKDCDEILRQLVDFEIPVRRAVLTPLLFRWVQEGVLQRVKDGPLAGRFYVGGPEATIEAP